MRKRDLFVLIVLLALIPCVIPTAQAQDITITNLDQLVSEAFSGNHCIYLPWSPFEWRAYSTDGGVPLWVDCSQLPCADFLPASTNLSANMQTYGVPRVGVVLTKNILTGVTTLQSDWATNIVTYIPAPSGYSPTTDLGQNAWVWRMWLQVTNCPDCWGIEGEIPPPIVTLRAFFADANDYSTWESNVEAEAEAAEAAWASSGSSFTSDGGRFLAMDGGGTMGMDGVSCTIPDETTPFSITDIEWNTSDCTITWTSCSDHLYEVQTTDGLLPGTQTVWTVQALMIGDDGSTSWSDTNAPAYDHRFYRVQRYVFWDDADGDGLANIDEFNLGTGMHNPDTDGDGVVDGDDPNPLNSSVGPASTNGFVRLYNAFGIYTNTTQIYLQANARSTNATVTVTRAEYYDTIVATNGGGMAMSALDGSFNSTSEVAIATFTPSFPTDQHHVYWLHARGSDGQWSPYVKVVINPNVNDILDKLQANYSAFQDLQFSVSITESQNGVTVNSQTATAKIKGPYKQWMQYDSGFIGVQNENQFWWHNDTLNIGGAMTAGIDGDFSAQDCRESDFFWDVPLSKTRADASITNSANSALFDLPLTPKPGLLWPAQHFLADYTKGFVTELDGQAEDVVVKSEYFNPVEVVSGHWLYTFHRHTMTFSSGDTVVVESTISSILVNQGLSDSLFDIPSQ